MKYLSEMLMKILCVRCDFPDFNDPHGIEYNLLNLFIDTLGVREVMNTTFNITTFVLYYIRKKRFYRIDSIRSL